MKFRPYNTNQTKFVNLDYRKILGEDSDAVIIHNIVEALDLSEFEKKYVEIGNPAYHPKMMMKIIIYGYVRNYYGGRPLYNNYETDLGLRFLSNDDFPDYRTINLFRVNFKEEIADIFSQVVLLCEELGLIGFKNLSIDGQKIKANANVFQNKDLKGIRKEKERIEKQLHKLLENKLDFQQENEEKIKKKKEKLERRKQKLDAAAQLLIKAGAENDENMRMNLTDPDSRIMMDKRGVKNPDYNAQNAVDDAFQVLTAVDVVDTPLDHEMLFPMKEKSKQNTGKNHENTIADASYGDKNKFVEMEHDDDTEYYVPDKTMYSSKKNLFSKWNFKKDLEKKDVYICPGGKEMIYQRTCKDSMGLQYRLYECADCNDCNMKDKCLRTSKKRKANEHLRSNRKLAIYPEDEYVKKMREKLETDTGKKIYQRRMSTVEPLHGDMQKNRGFIQFVLRGIKKVRVEYNLMGIAHNIRKIKLHAGKKLKEHMKRQANIA